MIQERNYGSKVNFDLMFTFINSKPVWNWILWISNSRIGIFRHTNNKIYKIYNYKLNNNYIMHNCNSNTNYNNNNN